MNKARLMLGVAIVLPAVLLAVGWWTAAERERESGVRAYLARLERTSDVVRAAIDESLEELRQREDSRPFYLYNRYYSPPDVLALSDPVAISPLAGEPLDPRIVGYFQMDPDGTLHTPYRAAAEDPPSARAERVLEIAGAHEDAFRRAALGPSNGTSALTPELRERPDEAREDALRERARAERLARREAPAMNLEPAGPLTVSLNQWGLDVYNDLSLAQQGDPEANFRVQERGRAAPITNRRNVLTQNPPPEPVPQQQAIPQQETAQRAAARDVPPSNAEPPQRTRTRMVELEPLPPPVLLPVVSRTQAEVDYAPMVFDDAGGALFLHRTVSHEGTSVVQGVVLDEREIVEDWIPSLVARHAIDEVPMITRDASQSCVLRAPASAVLPGVDFCFAGAGLRAIEASHASDRGLEIFLLALLFLATGAAVVAILRAMSRSEQLSRQKSAFVSAVSHELRTPLTTIRMHAEMLREGLVSEEKKPRFHDDLVNESVRLSRLVENVLELSRLEEGRRPLRLRRSDLAAFVAETISAQRSFLEAKGFEVKGPPPDRVAEVPFDGQAIEQIVVNLLDNAAKYAADSERSIDVDVTLEASHAIVIVRDRGPGIPATDRKKVFERFHRVERADTAHKPGTGIGLALVRDLSRAHGGDAEVHDREGGGLEVRVRIPLRAGERDESAEPEPEPAL
jgi:signal transduction histidine kinase